MQKDWPLARYWHLSVCDDMYCGTQGRCRQLKLDHESDTLTTTPPSHPT